MFRDLQRRSRLGQVLLFAGCTLVAACSDDSAERRRALGPRPDLEAAMQVADAARGARLFGQCAVCHTITKGAGDRKGPGLYGVMGHRIAGSSRRFGYTMALRQHDAFWSVALMDRWLAAPSVFAPTTSMNFPGVADQLDRADLIAYLQSATDRPPTR